MTDPRESGTKRPDFSANGARSALIDDRAGHSVERKTRRTSEIANGEMDSATFPKWRQDMSFKLWLVAAVAGSVIGNVLVVVLFGW